MHGSTAPAPRLATSARGVSAISRGMPTKPMKCGMATSTRCKPSTTITRLHACSSGRKFRSTRSGSAGIFRFRLFCLRLEHRTPSSRRPGGLLGQRADAIGGNHVRQQEVSHALVGVDLVFNAGKTVAFVLIDFRI